VNFESKSVTSLKKAFREAVNDYIETCKQIGKDSEKAYKGSFNVRVASKLHKEAAIVASQKNLSLNQFVQAAFSYAVKHDNEVIGR
jgi:predicted HicB family RNase H-like nuclease